MGNARANIYAEATRNHVPVILATVNFITWLGQTGYQNG